MITIHSHSVHCPILPPLLDNGMITYNPPDSPEGLNTTATYSCNNGYLLIGESTRTCQSDRTWSNTAPYCAGKYITWTTCTLFDCGIHFPTIIDTMYIVHLYIHVYYILAAQSSWYSNKHKPTQHYFKSFLNIIYMYRLSHYTTEVCSYGSLHTMDCKILSSRILAEILVKQDNYNTYYLLRITKLQ